ncbi:hypothetical protein ABID16_000084 [Rhizobium aquaticum]|uniref:Lipoprotein n=1 Tax=Rhizobium aquaticum TaxID=1549636 RepID=A0ABV2IVS9_9HYPH
MKVRNIAGLSALCLLAACQTSYTQMTWEPIIASPPLPVEMALARCQMASSSVDQGYFAMGSAEYVMGAGIGNAIANDMRRNDFVIQCMTMSGWRGVRPGAGPAPHPTRPYKLGGKFPPTPKPM